MSLDYSGVFSRLEKSVAAHDDAIREITGEIYGNERHGDDRGGLMRQSIRTQVTVDGLQKRMERLEEWTSRTDTVLHRLERQSTAMYRTSQAQRTNSLSYVFMSAAISFFTIIMASPVLISSIRTRIFGEAPHLWYSYLLVLAVVSLSAALIAFVRGQQQIMKRDTQ